MTVGTATFSAAGPGVVTGAVVDATVATARLRAANGTVAVGVLAPPAQASFGGAAPVVSVAPETAEGFATLKGTSPTVEITMFAPTGRARLKAWSPFVETGATINSPPAVLWFGAAMAAVEADTPMMFATRGGGGAFGALVNPGSGCGNGKLGQGRLGMFVLAGSCPDSAVAAAAAEAWPYLPSATRRHR